MKRTVNAKWCYQWWIKAGCLELPFEMTSLNLHPRSELLRFKGMCLPYFIKKNNSFRSNQKIMGSLRLGVMPLAVRFT